MGEDFRLASLVHLTSLRVVSYFGVGVDGAVNYSCLATTASEALSSAISAGPPLPHTQSTKKGARGGQGAH